MKDVIRVLINSTKYYNKIINLFKENNHTITEVITDFGDGEYGTREIKRDSDGNIITVRDDVFGRKDLFFASTVGVIMRDSNGEETALPHITMEHLAKTAESPTW